MASCNPLFVCRSRARSDYAWQPFFVCSYPLILRATAMRDDSDDSTNDRG